MTGLKVRQRLAGRIGPVERSGEGDLQVTRFKLDQPGAGAAGTEQRGQPVEGARVGELAGGRAVPDARRLAGDDLFDGAGPDDLAAVHDGEAVGELLGLLQVEI